SLSSAGRQMRSTETAAKSTTARLHLNSRDTFILVLINNEPRLSWLGCLKSGDNGNGCIVFVRREAKNAVCMRYHRIDLFNRKKLPTLCATAMCSQLRRRWQSATGN